MFWKIHNISYQDTVMFKSTARSIQVLQLEHAQIIYYVCTFFIDTIRFDVGLCWFAHIFS